MFCRFIAVAVLALLATPSAFAAWTDTTRKVEASGASDPGLLTSLGATAADSLIVCGTAAWKGTGAPAAISVSDPINGAYTQALLATDGGSATVSLHYVRDNVGGGLDITVDPSGGGSGDSNDISLFCHEFSGGDLTAPLLTQNTGTSSSTTANSGSVGPTNDNCLLVAVLNYDVGSATITENQGSQGFTLSNEVDGGAFGQPGSMVFKLVSGACSSNHTWTLQTSGPWVAGIAAFNVLGGTPPGGGGGGELLLRRRRD